MARLGCLGAGRGGRDAPRAGPHPQVRGIRNLIVPFVAFGDAYNSFPFLLWLWGGGAALLALGGLIAH